MINSYNSNNKHVLNVGDIVQHFKGKPYQILNIAKHSETGDYYIVYQQMYEPYDVYVRPAEMFMSEVDHKKYPDVYQKWRFQLTGHTMGAFYIDRKEEK